MILCVGEIYIIAISRIAAERTHETQAAPNEKVTITASDGTLLAAHLYAGTECAPVIIFFTGIGRVLLWAAR